MITAKQFQAPTSTGSGVTLSQGETKGLCFWRIGINAAAQKALFGRDLDPEHHAIILTVDPKPKERHVLCLKVVAASNAEGMSLKKLMRGSVGCKFSPWSSVAPGKRPAEGLSVILAAGKNEAKVKLPDWARPELPKPDAGKSIMED